MGGLLSVEMARRLRAAGEEVAPVMLLDPTPPGQASSLAAADEASLLEAFVHDLAGLGSTDTLPQGLREQMLDLYRQSASALRGYRPRRYDGRVDLYLACGPDGADRAGAVEEWQALAADGLEAHRFRCGHYDLLRSPVVSELARRLARRWSSF